VGRVEQTTSCARALTGLLGRLPTMEMLPASRMTRAALTGEVLRSQNPVPWPASLMRQLDPADPAYLPPMMGIHPVLAGRDLTVVGVPGRGGCAWVDPLGWCGVGVGPSIAVWFGEGRQGEVIGRQPGKTEREPMAVTQHRGDDGLSVVTCCTQGMLTLTLHHWPVVLQGEVAWVVYAKLMLSGPAARPVRLAFSIRPACTEGVAPIFELGRDEHGLWTADGVPIMAMSRHGDEVLEGAHGRADPFHRFAGLEHAGPPLRPGSLHVRCPAGQATASEIYRFSLSPGEPSSRFVVFRPPPGTPATLMRTTGEGLWAGALADRRGVLASGAQLNLDRHQALFVAARQRILLDTAEAGIGGMIAAVALARMGFVRRAGARLSRWMNQVKRDGSLPGTDPADAAILAWSASEFVRWTQDVGWRDEHRGAWRRLLDRLVDDPGQPGGALFFGGSGSGRWTAMWRAAALLSSAVQLRDVEPGHNRWAMHGGQAREALAALLGNAPWSATPGRRPDGAAAAMLAVAWIGLFDVRHSGVLDTLDHVQEHHWYGDGVLLNGGAHPALTALLAVVSERARPEVAADPIDVLAKLASPTGAFPTAHHPQRGALIDGDDLLSAAMFALVALDRVRADRDSLTILPDLVSCSDLPTPFGRISIEDGRLIGGWRGPAPTIVFAEA
jgi:hypothetical protein